MAQNHKSQSIMGCPDPSRRRLLMGLPVLLGCPALLVQAANAPSDAVLVVSGAALGPPAKEGKQVFDLAALQKMPQRTLRAATPWFNSTSEFAGPLLRDVLAAAGAPANGIETLRCTALNDYRVQIPIDDVRRYDVVLAHQFNGKPMSVREKGPLFVIYPFDEQPELRTTTYYNRCIWQLKAIDIL
jgi:hypothetical protein